MFTFSIFFIIAAIIMQAISISRVEQTMSKLKGCIRDNNDLQLVKRTINLNMQLAILYIVLCFLYVMVLVISIIKGASLSLAAINLLVFGVITLPIGLIGRIFEKKIKKLRIESSDPGIAARYLDYLTQWVEPRWQISDRSKT